MLQFYNSQVASNVEKIKNEIIEIEIKIKEFIYLEFLEYVNTGVVLNSLEFSEKLKLDFSNYKEKVIKTIEEQKQKNRDNFKKQMENHGKTLNGEIVNNEINLTPVLEVLNTSLNIDAYQKYQLLITKFNGGANAVR